MSFYQTALQNLGLRQRAYQMAFAEGPAHDALVDLARYSHAFAADPEGMTHDAVMIMHGRRQAFFHIFKHVKLTPSELEIVCKDALLLAEAKLQRINRGVENE